MLFGDQGGGVRGMDLKLVYCRYGSHFGSRWLSELLLSSVNTWCDITENVETL